MAKIKREGILARPGEYLLYGNREVKTADELKRAVDRQHEIMLTMGHANDGSPVPGEEQFVGTVNQRWDSEKNVVMADYNFYEEYWDLIPEDVRNKILGNQPVPISVGYKVRDVDEDHTQRGIIYTHVALVPENERPISSDVGVNIRMESKRELDLPDNYRLESSEIESPEEPEPVKAEPVEFVTKADFDSLAAQLKEFMESMRPAESVEPEAEVEEQVTEQLPTETAEPKPDVLLPNKPSEDDSKLEFSEDGFVKLR